MEKVAFDLERLEWLNCGRLSLATVCKHLVSYSKCDEPLLQGFQFGYEYIEETLRGKVQFDPEVERVIKNTIGGFLAIPTCSAGDPAPLARIIPTRWAVFVHDPRQERMASYLTSFSRLVGLPVVEVDASGAITTLENADGADASIDRDCSGPAGAEAHCLWVVRQKAYKKRDPPKLFIIMEGQFQIGLREGGVGQELELCMRRLEGQCMLGKDLDNILSVVYLLDGHKIECNVLPGRDGVMRKVKDMFSADNDAMAKRVDPAVLPIIHDKVNSLRSTRVERLSKVVGVKYAECVERRDDCCHLLLQEILRSLTLQYLFRAWLAGAHVVGVLSLLLLSYFCNCVYVVHKCACKSRLGNG